MPDNTGVESNIFLPELQYWFRKYWLENGELPLENYLKIPEINYDERYIKPNSIFELLFNNNYGNDISGSDTTSYDITSGVISDLYVITDDGT